MSPPPTVFVVDDDLGVRKTLSVLTEAAGLAIETYDSGREFLAAYDPTRTGCLVLDLRLRGDSGLDLLAELRRRRVTLPIIVLTGHGNVPMSVRALKAGAFDFLQKPVRASVLLKHIHAALEEDSKGRALTARRAAVTGRLASLTPREREVMELLVSGKASKAIATTLRLSVRTVEGHRRMIFLKMQVSSAAQLVRAVLSPESADPYAEPAG